MTKRAWRLPEETCRNARNPMHAGEIGMVENPSREGSNDLRHAISRKKPMSSRFE
jgi:hypothetical protein